MLKLPTTPQEFTDELIQAEQLTEYQKDAFKVWSIPIHWNNLWFSLIFVHWDLVKPFFPSQGFVKDKVKEAKAEQRGIIKW